MHEVNPQEFVGVVQPVEPVRNCPPSLFSTASMSLGVRGWDTGVGCRGWSAGRDAGDGMQRVGCRGDVGDGMQGTQYSGWDAGDAAWDAGCRMQGGMGYRRDAGHKGMQGMGCAPGGHSISPTPLICCQPLVWQACFPPHPLSVPPSPAA